MAKTAKAPDYEAAAEKQGQSSMEVTNYQTNANRPNQVTPFGSQSWQQTAVKDPVTGKMVPQWTQTTQLDPRAQHALDSQMALQSGRSDIGAGMLDRMRQEYGDVVDFGQFDKMGGKARGGKLNGQLGGANDYMGQAGNALMSQFNERMNPQFQQAEAHQDAVLRARGLKPGDEAYDSELSKLRQGQGDQRNQAMYQAQQLQAGEANRLQGMDANSRQMLNDTIKGQLGIDMDVSGFNTTRRQQQIAEELQKRGWSLNEANALISGQQVGMPSMPGFTNAGKSDAVQYSQAAGQQYQADADAANAQNAMTGQMMSAAGGFASMSDRRLKLDIKQIGTGFLGLPVYLFRYLWDKVGTVRCGYMADEVEAVAPHAVVNFGGFKAVHYDMLRA